MHQKRRVLIALAVTGGMTAGLGTVAAPASAVKRTFDVTLLGNVKRTITVDVGIDTPIDKIKLPGINLPLLRIVETTPAQAPPSSGPPSLTITPTAPTQVAPVVPGAPAVEGQTPLLPPIASGKAGERKAKPVVTQTVFDSAGRLRSITVPAPDRARPAKTKLRFSGGAPTTTNPTLSLATLGPVPIGVPNFFINKFRIPPFLLSIYQAAGIQYGIRWEVLAAINEIETDYGRNLNVSSAGAMGWMQFIYSSWERWGTDSDGDRRRDPRNPVDAIFAAARYLHEAGAQTDLPKAIFAYNHAGWYVNKVVERAREFAGLDATLVAALSERALREDGGLYRAAGDPFAGQGAIRPNAGQALLLSKRQLTRMVLDSAAITIYPGGRQDIAAGHIDRRVLATLLFLERSGLKPTVTSLFSGHSRMTTSGNVSAHSYGHAVDIAAINGISINGNQGAGSITATALDTLVQLQGYLRPNQIISLMTVDGRDNTLAMGDHADHIHVGFPRVPRVPDAGRPKDIGRLVAALRARATRP
jgi:hypothetical protein